MRDFRRLDVWQSAREFTADVYRVTRTFPREEVFGGGWRSLLVAGAWRLWLDPEMSEVA
jgi:hypothetical protein